MTACSTDRSIERPTDLMAIEIDRIDNLPSKAGKVNKGDRNRKGLERSPSVVLYFAFVAPL
jgi:hypothetical protein